MFVRFLGIILFLVGVVFLIKPALLRFFLRRKIIKQSRKALFAVVLVIGIYFFRVAQPLKGFVSLLVKIMGIVGIIKAFLLLRSKTTERVVQWFEQRSLLFFRAVALVYCILGFILVKQ